MYCRHCGKEIPDDSKFCQYCGGKQEIENPTNNSISGEQDEKDKKVIEIPTIKTNFSDKTKAVIFIYAVWVVLNAYCLFAGNYHDWSGNYFFPFTDDDLDSYDFSEFVVYVIGIPLAIWGLTLLMRKLNSIDENSNEEQQQ